MNFIKKNIRDLIIFFITMLLAQLIFAGSIKKFCGDTVFGLLIFVSFLIAVFLMLVVREISKNWLGQIALICVIGILFILSSVLFNADKIGDKGIVYGIFYLIFFAATFIALCYVSECLKMCSLQSVKAFLGANKWIFIVLAVIALVRVPYLEMLQRWDAGEYYYRFSLAAEEFEYTGIEEYGEEFSLCGHPTLAFSFIYLIGELVFPGQIIGVSIVSLIMTLAAMWCVYKIFMRVFAGISEKQAAVYTLLLSIAPLFFSTATYFNPDYAMSLFIIFVIYSYIFNKPLLAGFFSFMCFQTKETGLVLVGGLVIGVFIEHFMERKEKGFLKALFTDLRLYATLAATICQMFYYKRIGGLSNWSQNGAEEPGLRWDNNGENCLGFNVDFFVARIKQQFVLNFNWLVTLIIVVCIILLIVYKVKLVNKAQAESIVSNSNTDNHKSKLGVWNNNSICGIAASFIALLSFSCLFITSSVARYNVPGDILLYIIMLYLLFAVSNHVLPCILPNIFSIEAKCGKSGNYIIRAVIAVLAVLLIGQSFLTIDPITRLAFRKLDAVNTNIYYTGQRRDPDEILYYGDYLIYNTQYQYVDRAYDKMLRELDYEPGKFDVVLPDDNGCFINGNMYRLNWDKKREKRVFYSNDDTVAMEDYILIRNFDEELLSSGTLKNEAILLINPYWQHVDKEAAVEQVSKWYKLSEQKACVTKQGSIIYYNMTLKN